MGFPPPPPRGSPPPPPPQRPVTHMAGHHAFEAAVAYTRLQHQVADLQVHGGGGMRVHVSIEGNTWLDTMPFRQL
jgi:hypothetical protein